MRGATAIAVCCIGGASLAAAQDLLSSVKNYPQLSTFVSLLSNNSNLGAQLLTGTASAQQTLLIPSNAAFADYQSRTGNAIGSLTAADLNTIFSYHVLVGSLGATDFVQPQGLTAPSLLSGEQYDNRTGGAALSSVGGSTTSGRDGQVVFIAPKASGGSNFSVSGAIAEVQSGLGNRVNLTALNGTWNGGRFHMIDGFLTLPQICTQTIRANNLSSLDLALNRTGLSSVLDHLKNVTCLGPTDLAFGAAGNPDSKANVSDLTQALLFHTIPMPLYSNFLVSGQTFQTANNMTVRVTIANGVIYFNDAIVTKGNIITNNGLIHRLDRVMSPLSSNFTIPTITTQLTFSTSTAASGTASGAASGASSSATAKATSSSGASPDNSRPERWGITGLLGAALFFLL